MSYLWTDGSDYLIHHGIKGQRWGIRRYQNEDGSLTAAGRKRYGVSEQVKSKWNGLTDKQKSNIKKAAAIGVAVAGTALLAYGAYKVSEGIKNEAYKKSMDAGMKAVEKMMSDVTAYKNDEWSKSHPDSPMPWQNTPGAPVALIKDVNSTASRNSKTLAKSIDTLKGIRGFSRAELETMGIETFAPSSIFDTPATDSLIDDYRKSRSSRISKPNTAYRDFSDFAFKRVKMTKSDGSSDYVDVPEDKHGYASFFAKKMTEGGSSKPSDYDYYYNYMMKKLNSYGR